MLSKALKFSTALFFACSLAACSLNWPRWNTQVYRVHSGDTLYAIAWRYQLEIDELARWNDIQQPYTIYPGQELILLDPKDLPPERRPRVASSNTNQSSGKAASPASHKTQRKPLKPAVAPPKDFDWPTAGSVIKTFDGHKSGSQGIDIAGNVGQPVVAAAAGKVVYSGDGLVGFGNLLIVKHNQDYLSAYAYNRVLLVKEGDQVHVGQKIAEMGHAQKDIAVLHFEIRRQGRPVNPLKYLPKR